MTNSFLVCVFGELRAAHKCAKALYDAVIDPLGADVVVLAQRTFPDDEARLAAFDRRVVHAELYDKPDDAGRAYFHPGAFDAHAGLVGLWKDNNNVQQYVNWDKLSMVVKPLASVYDYLVILRSDWAFEVPCPGRELLASSPTRLWTVNKNVCDGININLVIVPSSVAVRYLSAPARYIAQPGLLPRQGDFNIEIFMKYIVDKERIATGLIQNFGYFTAETLHDRTTWGFIFRHATGVLGKYPDMVDSAFEAKTRWQEGWRWERDHDTLCLAPNTNKK